MDWDTVFSAIAGGLIGGGCTLGGVYLTNRNFVNEEKRKEKLEVESIISGIHTELEYLWVMYDRSMGVHIESLKDGEAQTGSWRVTQDYFTFYNANASKIGRIEDAKLRGDLVKTYTLLKSMLDTHALNDELLSEYNRYQELESIGNQTDKDFYREKKDLTCRTLEVFSDKVKESHFDAKQSVEPLLEELRTRSKNT